MRKLPSATIDNVLSWHPCETYSREKIARLFGRRKKATAFDILNHKKIPVRDKFWVVLRNHFLDDNALRLFAADCAEHVLHFYKEKYPNDKRPHDAIEAARKFARGEIDAAACAAAREAAGSAACAAAREAAGSAACAAARAAAGSAACAAAREAAREAAWAAAREAAWAAAWAAARAAACAAAREAASAKEEKWQIGRLKAYIAGKVRP